MLLFLKSLLWLNVLVATTFLATAIAGLEFSQNEIAPSILERLEKSTVLASLAYCDSSRIDECSRTKELKGFELVKAFHLHSDHQALVGIDHENKEIVVLFSGSLALVKHHNQLMQYTASLQSSNPKRPPSISSLSPIYQFLVDISSLEHQIQKLQPLPENIFSDKTGNIKINADYVDIYQHDGFGDGIQAALNLLLSVDKYPDHNIVFIGHSSGGSLASLALVDFSSSCGYSSKKSSPTLSLHTFGEPKAGNREYTNLVEKIVNNAGGHIFRSINRADPVPHLPPSLVPLDGSNTDSYSHYTATSTTAVWKHWSTGVNVYCQVNTENGQDVDCASLLHMNDLDIQDHFTYYGVSFQLQDHHHHSSSSTSSKTSSSASGSKPTSTPNEKQIARFDRVFFSRLYRLLAIMFRFRPTSSSSSSAHADSWIKRTWASLVNPKEDGSVAIYYLLLLLVSGANEVLVWFNGLSISEFYLCLDNRDFPAFRALIAKVTGLYVALSVAKSLLGFVGGMFAVRSRLRLTKCLQDGYIACSKSDKRSILYAILDSNQVDNPDQTIAQDVDKFGDTIRDILEQLVISPILIAWYTYQTAAANAGSLLGPGIIYGYFLISCLVCKSAISPLAPLIYAKERAEGDFRAKHLKLRENFEAIAALHGEHFEKREMSSVFQDLLSIEIVIIVKQMILKFITEFINNFGAALSYVVIAIPIFTGLLNDKSGAELSAIVSLNVFQSMYLIYRFTSITDMSQKISDLSGYTARIGYLLEVIENVDADEQVNVEIGSHKTCEIQQQHPETSPSPSFSDSIIIRDLALQIPKSSLLLFEKLDLKLDRFTNLVISGPNGAGKSTLLRAMAGLVTPSRGCINLPPFPQTMYLPQNVYMPSPSSLIDFLGYGCSGSIMHLPSTLDCTGKTEFTEDQALRALNKVGLENLVERFKKITAASGNHNEGSSLYHSFNMEEELSGGEKQRLHVARLILWKPTWAFIDEGFSGIDSAGRNRLLLELLKRDISLVVIMHDVEVPRANGVRWTHLRFPKTSGRAFVIEEIV